MTIEELILRAEKRSKEFEQSAITALGQGDDECIQFAMDAAKQNKKFLDLLREDLVKR